MAVATSVQISRYYDFFRDKEIVFTKANLKALRIDPRQIYLKCAGDQWPCLINSASLQCARILIGVGSGAYAEISKNKETPVSLRFCFLDANNAPIHFFVNCVVDSIKQYQNAAELAIVTLNFTQRPPDDLIMRIGEFVEINENFKNRKEDRIIINKDSIRKLGMEKEETIIYIDNVPRRCIFKNISFGGANVMLVGVPKFLLGKPVSLQIAFMDYAQPIILPGIIKSAAFLEGRKDISSVGVAFQPDNIPMAYKFHINDFMTNYQKSMLNVIAPDGVRIVNPEPVEPVAPSAPADDQNVDPNNNNAAAQNTNNANAVSGQNNAANANQTTVASNAAQTNVNPAVANSVNAANPAVVNPVNVTGNVVNPTTVATPNAATAATSTANATNNAGTTQTVNPANSNTTNVANPVQSAPIA